jgi:predicted Rossmann fold nucleotide-binding protein DprA/Smf involved in DNA uptake
MPSTTHVLDEARDLVKKRLAELDDERKRLERALAELGGKAVGRGPGRPAGRRGPGRPPGRPRKATRGAASPSSGGKARRRRRRSGTRADQAVSLVQGSPGISASEIAKSMKIKPNYLYRVLGELEKEGRVKKRGRQYHPAG